MVIRVKIVLLFYKTHLSLMRIFQSLEILNSKMSEELALAFSMKFILREMSSEGPKKISQLFFSPQKRFNMSQLQGLDLFHNIFGLGIIPQYIIDRPRLDQSPFLLTTAYCTYFCNKSFGPIPDSISICGVLMAPAQIMMSLLMKTLLRYRWFSKMYRDTAFLFSKRI